MARPYHEQPFQDFADQHACSMAVDILATMILDPDTKLDASHLEYVERVTRTYVGALGCDFDVIMKHSLTRNGR